MSAVHLEDIRCVLDAIGIAGARLEDVRYDECCGAYAADEKAIRRIREALDSARSFIEALIPKEFDVEVIDA